jgi:diacylglycerol kinase family enzyme
MPVSRIVALLNFAAGTVEHGGAEKLREALTAAFEQHGVMAEITFLPGTDLHAAAERALRRVKEGERDAIVVGGGDGSISTVATVLAGTGIPLGIIPLGTLNHFAKDLQIPLPAEEAVGVIAAGAVRSVDVGRVNGRIFINNSSIGVYPYLVIERDRRRRVLKLPKPVGMVLALFRVLRHLPLFRLRIGVQGWVEPCRSPCVFIGNNAYELTVPTFGRRPRLDAGELCIYVAKAQGRLALFWLSCRAVLGLLEQQRDLDVFRSASAEIGARRKRLLVAFDGEVELMQQPLRYQSWPGALRVFAPAPASS